MLSHFSFWILNAVYFHLDPSIFNYYYYFQDFNPIFLKFTAKFKFIHSLFIYFHHSASFNAALFSLPIPNFKVNFL